MDEQEKTGASIEANDRWVANNPTAKAADLDGNPYPSMPVGWMAFETQFLEGEQWKPEQIAAMMNRPWPPPAEVTPEMLAAGRKVWGYEVPAIPFAAIYRAMHAAAPVPLVSEAEDRAAALTKERDQVNADIEVYKEANRYLQACVDNLPNVATVKEMLDGRDGEITMLRRALVAKDDRIAELDSELAKRPAAIEHRMDPWHCRCERCGATRVEIEDNVVLTCRHLLSASWHYLADERDPVTSGWMPPNSPNPYRDFGHDPRRMGPVLPR